MVEEIQNDIKQIINELKKLDYKPIHKVNLTREERITLYDTFYSDPLYMHETRFLRQDISTFFVDEQEKSKIENTPGFKYLTIKDEEKVFTEITEENFDAIKQRFIEQLSEKEKQVILKCGISLDDIFKIYKKRINGEEYFKVYINEKINSIIENIGEFSFNDYVIIHEQGRPINREDKIMSRFASEWQDKKFKKAKDGLNSYYIYKQRKDMMAERMGSSNTMLLYTEFITFDDYATVKDIPIMGYVTLTGPKDTSSDIENNYALIKSNIDEIKEMLNAYKEQKNNELEETFQR